MQKLSIPYLISASIIIMMLFLLVGNNFCNRHDHIVTSGNLDFFGSTEQLGNTTGLTSSACINLSHAINDQTGQRIKGEFDFVIDCSNNQLPTGITQLVAKLFVNGVKQNDNVFQSIFVAGSTTGQTNPMDIRVNTNGNAFQLNSSTGKCTTNIIIRLEIPILNLSPGAQLDLVFYINADPKKIFHKHNVTYPNCIQSVAKKTDQTSIESAPQIDSLENSSSEVLPPNNNISSTRLLFAADCSQASDSTLLDYYTCRDLSPCHVRDHVLIYKLPNICADAIKLDDDQIFK